MNATMVLPSEPERVVATGTTRSVRERGAMLVELIMMLTTGLLLLSGALLAVVSHSNQRRVHTERTLALSACRNTLERLRSLDVATLSTFDGTGFDVPGIDGQPRGLTLRVGDSDSLPGEISVSPFMTGTGGDVYLVRTTVLWRGATRGGKFAMECLMGSRR